MSQIAMQKKQPPKRSLERTLIKTSIRSAAPDTARFAAA